MSATRHPRVALVTGAAGDIGRAVALRLAAEGVRVYVNDRNETGVGQVVGEVEASGASALPAPGDVSSQDVVASIFAELADREGGLDILVTQAGVVSLPEKLRVPVGMTREGWQAMVEADATLAFALHGTPEDFAEILDNNLRTTVLCCQAAVPQMLARGGGRIITMTAAGGGISSHFSPPYGVSKGAIVGLTRALARKHLGDNILVNCVSQGFIDAGVWRTAKDVYPDIWARDWRVTGSGDERTVWAEPGNPLPLERLGRPSEVAGLVAFLVSEDAGYLVGQTFNLSGGVLVP